MQNTSIQISKLSISVSYPQKIQLHFFSQCTKSAEENNPETADGKNAKNNPSWDRTDQWML